MRCVRGSFYFNVLLFFFLNLFVISFTLAKRSKHIEENKTENESEKINTHYTYWYQYVESRASVFFWCIEIVSSFALQLNRLYSYVLDVYAVDSKTERKKNIFSANN